MAARSSSRASQWDRVRCRVRHIETRRFWRGVNTESRLSGGAGVAWTNRDSATGLGVHDVPSAYAHIAMAPGHAVFALIVRVVASR
jgi:hypothetical protein